MSAGLKVVCIDFSPRRAVIAPQTRSFDDVDCVKTIKIHLSRVRICEQTSRKLPRADSRARV